MHNRMRTDFPALVNCQHRCQLHFSIVRALNPSKLNRAMNSVERFADCHVVATAMIDRHIPRAPTPAYGESQNYRRQSLARVGSTVDAGSYPHDRVDSDYITNDP